MTENEADWAYPAPERLKQLISSRQVNTGFGGFWVHIFSCARYVILLVLSTYGLSLPIYLFFCLQKLHSDATKQNLQTQTPLTVTLLGVCECGMQHWRVLYMVNASEVL